MATPSPCRNAQPLDPQQRQQVDHAVSLADGRAESDVDAAEFRVHLPGDFAADHFGGAGGLKRRRVDFAQDFVERHLLQFGAFFEQRMADDRRRPDADVQHAVAPAVAQAGARQMRMAGGIVGEHGQFGGAAAVEVPPTPGRSPAA